MLGNTSPPSKETYENFLRTRKVRKPDESGEPPLASTNTRIGDAASGLYGGNYHIPESEYKTFLDLYHATVIASGALEYLTEKQLSKDGPILIDLDLRFAGEVKTRVFTYDHVFDILCIYVAELRKMYQFDSTIDVPVFIFEKDTVNHLAEKNVTKDGIHIIIGIKSDPIVQCMLRERVLARARSAWEDLPIINSWEDVFDAAISKGTANWQLYGSRKPNNEAYKLKYAYSLKLDETDNEISINPIADIVSLWSRENFPKLSARYARHPELFMTREFAEEYAISAAASDGKTPSARPPAGPFSGGRGAADNAELLGALFKVRDREQLDVCLNQFLDSLTHSDLDLHESYDYCMCLPASYYGPGSYTKWMKVGWALRNTSDRLFIVWVAFSAQYTGFDYCSIRDEMYPKWAEFSMNNSRGLTKRSLMHWAKQDSPSKYNFVRSKSVDFYIEETLDKLSIQNLSQDRKKRGKGCGDFALATVLHQMKKDAFVCVSVSANKWYRFRNHRWCESDAATELRRMISEDMQRLYVEKVNSISRFMLAEGVDLTDTKNARVIYLANILDIVRRMEQTREKDNIMKESKELFYDSDFMDKLDVNTHLLCCANGVVDFTEKTFRDGRPEDCVSKSTHIDYIALDYVRDKTTMAEINDFMDKLFPDKDLHRYMWDHLASTLIGKTDEQTINMYIGIGQNGKSVLVNLMEHCLGDYKSVVPLALLTKDRAQIGGLAPELVQLKGVRYAVIQEPSKGDVIREGPMKELTGGDPILARAPYMTKIITYTPQFKLIMCTNTLMEIKVTDHATWRRIRVDEFESLFTENPVDNDPEKPYQYKLDKTIKDKFKIWRTVFLAMLVERAFKTNGVVEDCAKVLAASNSYREGQDCIAEFIRDKISCVPKGVLSKTVVVSAFREWYTQNYGFKNTSTKDITAYLNKKFGKNSSGVWVGVCLKSDLIEEPDASSI